MDPALIAAAAISASAGLVQQDIAGKMLAQNIDAERSAVKLIDAAQQSLTSLANVAAGIGTNVNLSV